jgi:hypothetical protein
MESDGDRLREAVAELYSADPAEFVERRGALAAQARAAGEASAAKSIAALRKPTRSAWVVNQLIRSDPGVTAELGGLGDELRAAQGSMDGAAIRELSVRRRQLIAELSRRAFAVSGLPSPPAALRDEVNATLGAALADPQVAEQLAAGALERPAHADGFGPAGPAGPPVLTVVPSPGARRAQARPQAATRAGGARRVTAQERAEAAAQARAEAAAREQAERAERRRAALADAERAVAEADQAAAAAATAELDLESSVQRLEEELADARQGLTNARLAARRARNRQRQARQARDRLQGTPG